MSAPEHQGSHPLQPMDASPSEGGHTAESAAAALNGCEYGEEGNAALWRQMKAAGLVALFGASDDLAELRGAVDDEVGCYDGGEILLTPAGLFEDCEEACIHSRRAKAETVTIKALWCAPDQPSWTYETRIPHSTFEVREDGEVYCRGIVFALSAARATQDTRHEA